MIGGELAQLLHQVEPAGADAAMEQLNTPAMPTVQRIARDPIQRRQSTPGAQQQYVLIGSAWNVEAVAERLGDRHDVSGFQVVEDPSAHQSTGESTYMQQEVVIQ